MVEPDHVTRQVPMNVGGTIQETETEAIRATEENASDGSTVVGATVIEVATEEEPEEKNETGGGTGGKTAALEVRSEPLPATISRPTARMQQQRGKSSLFAVLQKPQGAISFIGGLLVVAGLVLLLAWAMWNHVPAGEKGTSVPKKQTAGENGAVPQGDEAATPGGGEGAGADKRATPPAEGLTQ